MHNFFWYFCLLLFAVNEFIPVKSHSCIPTLSIPFLMKQGTVSLIGVIAKKRTVHVHS